MVKGWYDIPLAKQNTIKTLIKNRHWKHLFKRHGSLLGAKDRDDAKAKGKWLESHDFKPPKQQYWYDSDRDVYVLHLKNLKNPFVLRAQVWAQMREAYSNWDGAPATVNEIARKFSMSRATVKNILKLMGTTHDSPMWTEDIIEKNTEDALVDDLLQRKLQSVLVKAEQKEWSRIKRDANLWRRLDLLAQEIEGRFVTSQEYKPPKINLKKTEEPFVAVISPTDYHWGKYASGPDPYNREIAKKRLFESTIELLSRLVIRGSPEKIVVAIGGDGLHFDTYDKKTTRGTHQDVDGTPEEIAWSWVELCRDYVNLIAQVAPVELFVIPGNHDRFTTVFLRAAMKGWFSTVKSVNVVEALAPRQYMKYGNSMLSFLHGDIGKVKDWPAIIAGEEPVMWGQTKHKFIFTGHFHTERELPTFGNVTVYRMPSLAGTDTWHFNNGYKSRKALICYIIDKEKGVIATEIEPV